MFLDGTLTNKVFMLLCYAGSMIAFLFGLLAEKGAIDPVPGLQIAIIGIVTAMVGLFGGVAVPAWKLWLEYREKVRDDLRKRIDDVIANQEAFLAVYNKAQPATKPPPPEDAG